MVVAFNGKKIEWKEMHSHGDGRQSPQQKRGKGAARLAGRGPHMVLAGSRGGFSRVAADGLGLLDLVLLCDGCEHGESLSSEV